MLREAKGAGNEVGGRVREDMLPVRCLVMVETIVGMCGMAGGQLTGSLPGGSLHLRVRQCRRWERVDRELELEEVDRLESAAGRL